jgi:replicative DNA helicase
MEKNIPIAIEAEKSVLGCILLDKDAFFKIADLLTSDDFYHQHHQIIFEKCLELFQKMEPIDMTTIATKLESQKKLELIGGPEYLAELQNMVPVANHIFQYAQITKHRSTLRKLIKAGQDISALGYDSEKKVEELLENAEKRVFSISSNFVRDKFVHIKDILTKSYDKFVEIHENPELANDSRMATKFSELDSMLSGGVSPSDLIIIAARPSMGKTALALEIAQRACMSSDKPKNVGVISLEMSKEQLVERMFCGQLKIDSWKLHKGQLNEKDFENMGPVMDKLSKAPIFIDDSMGSSIVELRAKIRRLQMEKGIDMLIIDYLQLMSSSSAYGQGNRVNEISEISRSLKQLARELHIPIIALSQLSRSVEGRPDKHPILSDLRDSGSIEQDADVVMMLYRPSYYDDGPEVDKNLLEVNVLKHRNGRTGVVKIEFDRGRMAFGDYKNQQSGF